MKSQDPAAVGPPTWRVFAAFGVVLMLLAALVVVSRHESEPLASEAAGGGGTEAQAPTSSPTGAATETEVMSDAQAALAAWGLFAATGDLDAVYSTFSEGPQLDQLLAEAPDRAARGPGPPAFNFEMVDGSIIDLAGESATIRTSVRMTRPGTDPADFDWMIEMRRDDQGKWRLYTVSSATG